MTIRFNPNGNINLNPNNKIECITVKLSAIEFMIFHEAISEYAEERTKGIDKEVANIMLKTIEELRSINGG